ncbi:glycosyltransferase family 25 protein [Nitratireductor sp. ZSWI3]|uniref:glycosyltransferase family 25 protein n=1 Tax=Nitratireductor sp. ZSWI3 TaxID=2966359 RepID=UPI002150546C|nr:glycosyltransferase family 25 protein [Nitratireductor sp. ZSWI3]MCR4267010.1 glycosyltransferase family 25 protein [Nitratireductor sp. ZSWI3]
MKSYVINLDRSVERLDYMRGQFDSLGIGFERIPAVDGSTLEAADFSTSPLRLPVIGCLLSHHAAWRKLLSSEDVFAAVFEDDAILKPEIKPLLTSSDWIPEEVGIVKLETTDSRVMLGRPAIPVAGARALHRLLSDHHGTAGYIIHRHEAELLLDETSTFQRPVDLAMFATGILSQKRLRVFQINPAPVRQRSLMKEETDPAFLSTMIYDAGAEAERSGRSLAGKIVREAVRPVAQLSLLVRKIIAPSKPVQVRVPFS